MYGTLQLTAGPGGLRAGPFLANLGVTLAIGDTEPVKVVLDKRLPSGPWDALVALHSGLINNSARATITFPNTKAAAPPYPVIVALAIALLGIATLLTVIRRRSRRQRSEQRRLDEHDPDHRPAEETAELCFPFGGQTQQPSQPTVRNTVNCASSRQPANSCSLRRAPCHSTDVLQSSRPGAVLRLVALEAAASRSAKRRVAKAERPPGIAAPSGSYA
jgi:hypothetical protein